MLRLTLGKIEAGDIGSLDLRGFFLCSICGQQGLGLTQILLHEETCRERLNVEGQVSQSRHEPPVQQVLTEKFADLKAEISKAEAPGSDPSELLALSLDRLRDVVRNACVLEEKKYRRLRMSNAAVAEAVGRWKAAVEMLQDYQSRLQWLLSIHVSVEAVGFEMVLHTSKTGNAPEPHLILQCQLEETTLQAFLDVLEGKQTDTDAAMLEECGYCHRKFRFDRIAKHETRCPESKPKPAKLDIAQKLLVGTPGEKHIPDVRRELLNGTKLPPLRVRKWDDSPDGLRECFRCKRRFSAEALEKHAKRCTASLRPSPREPVTPPIVGQTVSSSAQPTNERQKHSSRELSSGRRKIQEKARDSAERVSSATGCRDQNVERSGGRIQSKLAKERLTGDLRQPGSYPSAPSHGQPCYDQLELDVADWLDG
ncbi:unnamed protein product [Durusdinium trenchii]